MPALCVFCGSATGIRPDYLVAAQALGHAAAERGVEIVYGGARVGLMGAMADAALAAGGRVTGVIPRALVSREIAHEGLTTLHVVDSMHQRKATMAQLADAFVALPGGVGTLEELFEVWTWAHLGVHAKPCAVLDVAGFWQPLVAALDHMVAEGFVRAEVRALLVEARDPAELFARLAEGARTEGARTEGARTEGAGRTPGARWLGLAQT
jgi:uncharacterized protein (TIGR00730 family)